MLKAEDTGEIVEMEEHQSEIKRKRPCEVVHTESEIPGYRYIVPR